MAATATLLYQKHGVNYKTTVAQVVFTGNYPGDPGELVNFSAGSLLNPAGRGISGPNGFPPIPPRPDSVASGGWRMELEATAVAGQYEVSLWNGTTELTAIAYPEPVLTGVFTVELDFDLQGYNN